MRFQGLHVTLYTSHLKTLKDPYWPYTVELVTIHSAFADLWRHRSHYMQGLACQRERGRAMLCFLLVAEPPWRCLHSTESSVQQSWTSPFPFSSTSSCSFSITFSHVASLIKNPWEMSLGYRNAVQPWRIDVLLAAHVGSIVWVSADLYNTIYIIQYTGAQGVYNRRLLHLPCIMAQNDFLT
jgi:hypothetical protein